MRSTHSTRAPHRAPVRCGFTLIEMLIAIALGLTIVYTAMAGFRVASQSVTVANRLALENSLMRAGYFVAVDEADFWQAYDDPLDADQSRRKLRGFASNTGWRRGLPFSRFAESFPRSGVRDTEEERGWDPDYAWPASDSRAWFHGNLVEQVQHTKHVFGHYELFAHAKTQVTLGKVFLPNGVAFSPDAAIRPRHTWLYNQIEGLKNALGYYGACEYLPANTIYASMGDPGGDNAYGTGDDNDQSWSMEWTQPQGSGGGVQWRFANDDGGTAWPRGIYRHTRDSTFPLVPASPDTAAQTSRFATEELIRHHNRSWATARVGAAHRTDPGNYGILDLTQKALIRTSLMPSRPETWPDLKVSVMRYLNNSRFTALCKVGWTSPLTGELVEISFSTLGTTLRGARQQRAPSGGWAAPGEANLDAP